MQKKQERGTAWSRRVRPMLTLTNAAAGEIEAFITDDRGDMAEKGVVLAVIILACLAMWQALGTKISSWVSRVAGAYN